MTAHATPSKSRTHRQTGLAIDALVAISMSKANRPQAGAAPPFTRTATTTLVGSLGVFLPRLLPDTRARECVDRSTSSPRAGAWEVPAGGAVATWCVHLSCDRVGGAWPCSFPELDSVAPRAG